MEKSGSLNLNFIKDGREHRYKVAFLNGVFLLAGIVAFIMGFIRWQSSVTMGMIDFGFAGLDFALLAYLHRHRDKVELVSWIAIALSFGLFSAVYVLAPYNTMRLSLFFLLLAAVFFLKGRKSGRIWLGIILLTILTVHVLPIFNTGYSHVDIFTTCLYLFALFVIYENYETFKESQRASEDEQEMLRLTEERWRHAVEGAGDAVWDWKPETGEFHYSRRFAEMLGYAEGEFGNQAEAFLQNIHPDDKLRVRNEFNAYLKRNAGHYVSEMRLACKDGSWKWLLCRGTFTRRDAGRCAFADGRYLFRHHLAQATRKATGAHRTLRCADWHTQSRAAG